jgi:hypothetical protein
MQELLVAFGTVTQINLQMDERGMSKVRSHAFPSHQA